MLINMTISAQSVVINGHVSDASTNEPLPFVNVVEVDANGRFVAGTTTDINGNYILRVSSSKANILVSFIGYKKFTAEVGASTKIDVALESESTLLDEIVVTGQK
ncbi:MAG: hypothetical protein HC906_00295 [Bacteroidales bacterium]|nr:hypothetical protein [Bacteroidales bacterium]